MYFRNDQEILDGKNTAILHNIECLPFEQKTMFVFVQLYDYTCYNSKAFWGLHYPKMNESLVFYM